MALSDWDTLAFGPDGKPCNGVFEHPNGCSIEIYKNWAYIHAPKMWQEGYSSFVYPTIAEFSEGSINICNFSSVAMRHEDQMSIFIFASYGEDIDGEYQSKYFAGIGCSGYEDDGNWVGVKPETLRDFYAWLEEIHGADDEWVQKVKAEKPLRFNQGDAYFASKLPMDLPATAPGEAKAPLIIDMMKGER